MHYLRVAVLAAACAAMAGEQPVQVVLAVEMSPGTEQAIGLIRARIFQPEDRVGVVVFATRGARTLASLTSDRNTIDSALQKAGIRVAINGATAPTTDLAAGLSLACEEFDRNGSSRGNRAIIVIFQAEDPTLGERTEAIEAALERIGARLYAIVIDRAAVARSGPGFPPPVWTPGVPGITARTVSEIARATGGEAIHKNWDIRPVLKELRKK